MRKERSILLIYRTTVPSWFFSMKECFEHSWWRSNDTKRKSRNWFNFCCSFCVNSCVNIMI